MDDGDYDMLTTSEKGSTQKTKNSLPYKIASLGGLMQMGNISKHLDNFFLFWPESLQKLRLLGIQGTNSDKTWSLVTSLFGEVIKMWS